MIYVFVVIVVGFETPTPCRQRAANKSRIDKFLELYIIFTVGLALWTYYQLVMQIGTPFPSSADAFWLWLRIFTCFMFRIYNFLSEGSEKFIVVLVSLATAIILGYIQLQMSLIN
jgi:hypothetical protein